MICNSTDARQVLAGLVVDDLDLLARHDELSQVFERDVAAGAGVIQAAIGVFAYEAFLLHGLTPGGILGEAFALHNYRPNDGVQRICHNGPTI